VKLTTHLRLVPMLRMCGAMPPLPQHTYMVQCSVKAQGQLFFRIWFSDIFTVLPIYFGQCQFSNILTTFNDPTFCIPQYLCVFILYIC